MPDNEKWRDPESEGMVAGCSALETQLDKSGNIIIKRKKYEKQAAFQMFKLIYGEDFLTIRAETGLNEEIEIVEEKQDDTKTKEIG